MLFTIGLLYTEDLGEIDLIWLKKKIAYRPTICNANFSTLFNAVRKKQSAMDGSSTVTSII